MECTDKTQRAREILKAYGGGCHADYGDLSEAAVALCSDFASELLSEKEEAQQMGVAVIVEQLALGGKRERRLFLNMLRQFVEGDWAGERARAEARVALGLFSEKVVLKRAFPREAANAGRKKAATDTQENSPCGSRGAPGSRPRRR